jgi:hypothetical protein
VVNRLESCWGQDAHEFKPSRWLDGMAYKGEAVGPYANLSVHPIIQLGSHRPLNSDLFLVWLS